MLETLAFQLCGLQSYAGPNAPLGSSLALLWCIANSALYMGVLAYCLVHRMWLFEDPRPGTGINFIPFIKSCSTIVAHLVVLLEALLARGFYRALDHRITSIDGMLVEMSQIAEPCLVRARRRFRTKLLLFGVACWAVGLGILAMDYGNPPQRVTWCLTVSSLFVIRMKHLHHAYHIDRLAARFDILREQLESLIGSAADNLGEWSGTLVGKLRTQWTQQAPRTALLKSHRNGPRESNQRRIFTAKGTYLALWRASKDLNECCVYSQLANLLQNFIQCTCDLYTMYSLLYLNQISDIFGYILNVVATFAALGVVLAACENCKNQVGQMGQALHKRRGDEADWLATMIENFSLLLQHTPVCFSLGGFFDMDFMLLKEMAAAITTYMVIFIQFMPKDEPVTAPLANSTITPTSG